MTDERKPLTEEERYAATMSNLVMLLGDEWLVHASERIVETTTPQWHADEPDTDPDKCICPALMAYTVLYERGFGIMHIEDIRRAGPVLQEMDRKAAQARQN